MSTLPHLQNTTIRRCILRPKTVEKKGLVPNDGLATTKQSDPGSSIAIRNEEKTVFVLLFCCFLRTSLLNCLPSIKYLCIARDKCCYHHLTIVTWNRALKIRTAISDIKKVCSVRLEKLSLTSIHLGVWLFRFWKRPESPYTEKRSKFSRALSRFDLL